MRTSRPARFRGVLRKPDGLTDGHPQSSKLNLFESFVRNIVDRVKAKPELFANTAIFVTFDEGGGYYDLGFIQPLDFFGDGPRIPFIVVSPYSTGGHIDHGYADHASVVKFIERNWGLSPLSDRSRDNLPNPEASPNPYVPANIRPLATCPACSTSPANELISVRRGSASVAISSHAPMQRGCSASGNRGRAPFCIAITWLAQSQCSPKATPSDSSRSNLL